MKKIYSLLAMSTIVGASFAQVAQLDISMETGAVKTLDVERNENFLKGVETDTAGWSTTGNFYPEFANAGGPVIIGYQGGGYFYGSNNDSLNSCAQGYENANNSTAEIKEILIWFAAKDSVSNSGSMNINLYEMSQNRAIEDLDNFAGTPDAEGPNNTPVASETLLLSDADTASSLVLTSVVLSSPVSVNGNFAVEVDASSFAASGDTIGIVSDGDGSGQGYSFVRRGPGYYWIVTRAASTSGLDNNIAIFAVIGDNNVGIDDDEFFNGVQLSAFPNPAVEMTTISFNLERSFNNVKINVMDATGKIVNRIEKGALQAGLYNEVMEVSSLSAGTYYYTIYADNTKLTKSFNVVK
ncbi:MAG: T9SS type A sorting domain-containing protein [Flavobacteriales bacterium]|jgi:hypothetical protein|nr:T9SS type A sorting domain-containing protein [Flavobacteriales bacterium]